MDNGYQVGFVQCFGGWLKEGSRGAGAAGLTTASPTTTLTSTPARLDSDPTLSQKGEADFIQAQSHDVTASFACFRVDTDTGVWCLFLHL